MKVMGPPYCTRTETQLKTTVSLSICVRQHPDDAKGHVPRFERPGQPGLDRVRAQAEDGLQQEEHDTHQGPNLDTSGPPLCFFGIFHLSRGWPARIRQGW